VNDPVSASSSLASTKRKESSGLSAAGASTCAFTSVSICKPATTHDLTTRHSIARALTGAGNSLYKKSCEPNQRITQFAKSFGVSLYIVSRVAFTGWSYAPTCLRMRVTMPIQVAGCREVRLNRFNLSKRRYDDTIENFNPSHRSTARTGP
jgi:hypothetical protein